MLNDISCRLTRVTSLISLFFYVRKGFLSIRVHFRKLHLVSYKQNHWKKHMYHQFLSMHCLNMCACVLLINLACSEVSLEVQALAPPTKGHEFNSHKWQKPEPPIKERQWNNICKDAQIYIPQQEIRTNHAGHRGQEKHSLSPKSNRKKNSMNPSKEQGQFRFE